MPRMPHIITPKEFTRRDLLRLASITIGCCALSKAADAAVLGARGVAMGGGIGGLSAKSYVQDGFLAMFDGIENIDFGIHSNESRVWKDLIGGNDCTLTSKGYFGDSFLQCTKGVEGSDAYCETSATGGLYYQNVVSAEIVFKADDFSGLENPMIVPFVILKNYRYLAVRSSSGHLVCIDGYGAPFDHNRVLNINTISLVWNNNSKPKIYVNAQEMHVESLSTGWNFGDFLSIGGRHFNNTYELVGKVFSLRIYGVSLTDQQIAANYAIDKARFNLP